MALIHERMNRGRTQMGWLDSFHSFSFGAFHDPSRMGVRNLRVINEDRVIPGAGFGEHGHQHMDILTYVLSGALKHGDSMGNSAEIRPGEIQLMSAGPGVMHSEMNASETEPVHFLQIWITPERAIQAPTYGSLKIDDQSVRNRFGLVAGGEDLPLLSDTQLHLARLDDNARLKQTIEADREGFLHIVKGQVTIEGETLNAGDALQFDGPTTCEIVATNEAELLLFDLG